MSQNNFSTTDNTSIDHRLTHTSFLNRENDFRHFSYDAEMQQYEYLKNGDPRFIDACRKSFHSEQTGHLSDDPLRNLQYLFVCFITIVTRFCVEGGLNSEEAYNISDLYIQQVDRCQSVAEIYDLHEKVLHYYYKLMSGIARGKIYSRPIVKCMDYIYDHLHESIRLRDLAEYTGLNSSYLSSLFKKELAVSITEYITSKKIEAAENMLKYSDFSQTEISSYLAFSSHSYFISVFKKHTGMTPGKYKEQYFRIGF